MLAGKPRMKAVNENNNHVPDEFGQARALREKLIAGKNEMRKRLAALSFTKKIKILEKLRDRDRAIAASGLRRKTSKDTTNEGHHQWRWGVRGRRREAIVDSRKDLFAQRFRSAQTHLKTKGIHDLVSLKYRGRHDVPGSAYLHFVDDLTRGQGLDVAPVDGGFGGQAWLVTDRAQNRAILVEHETGLEILSAIGSVASLIALLPMISSGWIKLRHRLFGPPNDRPDGERIEVRRIDLDGNLIEQQLPSIEVYFLNTALRDHSLLTQRVNQLEDDVKRLKTREPRKGKKQTARSKRKKKKK
jgi:hypothetical protein